MKDNDENYTKKVRRDNERRKGKEVEKRSIRKGSKLESCTGRGREGEEEGKREKDERVYSKGRGRRGGTRR